MGKINLGRVILGGLLTGLVINVGEYLLNEVVFVQQLEEMVKRLNVTRPGGTFIAVAIIMTFLLGIVIVLIYAMIRARFGPGPKTAIYAGLIAWFCIYVYAGVLNSVLFGLTPGLLLIGILWGLVEYVLGALAGAWYYKES